MKILITGANGQLGQEFIRKLEKQEKNLTALGHDRLDVGNLKQVLDIFEDIKPNIVINCSAYNQVDKAEEQKEIAYRTNAIGPKNLAFASEKYRAFLVHYSTDYVFDGTKQTLYIEEDNPEPLSEYAQSKYLGELFLKEETENYLIFRTSWVYGHGKQNFLYKLTQWAQTQEYLKIACDEFSVPTSTKTIVEVTLKAIDEGLTGVYHLVNSGFTSRFEWAREFLKLKGINKFIYPAHQSDFNLPARRPRFSAMSNEKICKVTGIQIRDWKEEMKGLVDKQKI